MDSSWHHVHFTAWQLSQREHERMKLMFSWFYAAAGRPQGMSLWLVSGTDGGADIYISPLAVRSADSLVRYYHGQPCDPPEPPERATVLIAGSHYSARPPIARALTTTLFLTRRRLLPARYACRSVRALTSQNRHGAWAYVSHQVAPFVRRYIRAWALSPPSRAHHGR